MNSIRFKLYIKEINILDEIKNNEQIKTYYFAYKCSFVLITITVLLVRIAYFTENSALIAKAFLTLDLSLVIPVLIFICKKLDSNIKSNAYQTKAL